MLSFFRRNSGLQLFSLIALFLCLRLPLLISGTPLLIPELGWMLTGEQMSKGFLLYRDIWDNVSPLAGVVYWGIDSLFGRSQFVYHLIALGLSLFQLLYFNYIARTYDFFNDRSLIPGLVYAVLLNTSYDMITLSPMLMAATFLLLAIGVICKQLSRPEVNNEIFEAGLYIGIATLFYLPSALFYIWAFVTLILYTGATFRHHLLGFFGSIFPLLMVTLYFFFTNSIGSLNRNLLTPTLGDVHINLDIIMSFLLSMAIPIVLAFAGFFRLLSHRRMTHLQGRIQQTMAIWILVALCTLPFMEFLSPMQFLLFVPAIGYFVTWYFTNFKKQYIADLVFVGYFFFTVLIFYKDSYKILPSFTMGELETLKAKPALLPQEITNKKIVVLGPDEGEYINNQAATPYLKWSLAANDLRNLDNFESVIHVYENFLKDSPEYIIDKENIMPKLFKRIPQFKEMYTQSSWKNIYKRKS